MLFELAYPGLCALALWRRAMRRPTPAGPMFAFRAVRGRMRRQELNALTALNPEWGAMLALHRFERMTPDTAQEAPDALTAGCLAERRFGPENGPRVLLLHGWNARSAMMTPLALALAASGARVILPDLPGEGCNPARPMSFSAKARILAAQYREEDIDTVIGHSAGGLIAAQVIEAGLTAARLVTICAPYSMETLLRAYLCRISAPIAVTDALLSRAARREGRAPHEIGPELFARMGSRLMVIHARRDWQVRLSEAEDICSIAPAARALVLDACNHHSILDDPRLFEGIVCFALPETTRHPASAHVGTPPTPPVRSGPPRGGLPC
ncbi:alpha/beta hydrolase [Epibacterium sp. MM17-32]|jgi:pimeloyl-ACP methyl ester carboxylesterase|uniref:alpha/beta fold hydrolase n=1 Tax=Epibacterium sp. MM17-32 TaxID=2917734 RepID=UPI001EF51D63|nr:alpha/beta fold hydrolase [Epibacterium sp. MM17-32]MCG7626761.1 alpha/beta hydrolase [Epibacterium sp. MM17-32]